MTTSARCATSRPSASIPVRIRIRAGWRLLVAWMSSPRSRIRCVSTRAAAAAPPPGEEPLVDVGINVFQFVRDRAEEPPLESLYRARESLS